jgi:polyisoprenoid-binding protein YceI
MMLKRRSFLTATAVCLLLFVSATAWAQSGSADMKVDGSRSQISFVSEAPAEKIVGTADELKGAIAWNFDNLAATSGTISFPVTAMKTGNRLRDRHLHGKDWLDAKNNPNVEFRLTGLENVQRSTEGDQVIIEADAVGQVTVNGVAAPNRSKVRIVLLPERRVARIQPTMRIALANHNVAGKRGYVGDKVGESIDIEGVIYATWE